MSGERQVNVLPSPQGIEQDVSRQGLGDFDVLCNVDLSRGIVEARRGWKVVRTPNTYSTVVDAGGTSRYEPATYKSLAWENLQPLGAFLYSAPDGIDYVLACLNSPGTDIVYCAVHTTTGHRVNGPLVGGAVGQSLVSGTAYDQPVRPYTFAVFGQWVYFCNGGRLWRWSHRTYYVEDVSTSFAHAPTAPTTKFYLTALHGAGITCEHNGSLVYAGFDLRYLPTETITDTNQDGVITTQDLSKDGFVLSPNATALQATPYTFAVSDFGLPRSVALYSLRLALGGPVTGLASHNRRLVVFTRNSMRVVDGSVPAGTDSMSLVSDGIGCVAHNTIRQTRSGLLVWLSTDGVYAWDGSGQPQRISRKMDALFTASQETSLPTQYGANFNPKNFQWPWRNKPQWAHFASAVVHQTADYYAVALSAGSSVEWNNLVLCIDPRDGRCWTWASRPQLSNASRDGCAGAGMATLLVSQNQPDAVLGQAFYVYDPDDAPADRTIHTSIVVQQGAVDENLQFPAGAATFEDTKFDMLAVSSRFFLGDSSQKVMRQAHVRMYATRRHDFATLFSGSTDTNKIQLAYLPEFAGFDLADQTDTATVEYVVAVEPWPDQFRDATYFWQKSGATSAAIGRWDNGATTADKFWQGTMLFDKRVDLRSGATQFCRISLWKVVDNASGPSLRFVSLAMAAKAGAGQR